LLVLEAVTRRARITDDEHWHNVVDRGNTGAAGAPTVLSQRWGELKRGDVVILAVVGSGLTWSSLRIEID
jgi:3-oxoacyl-[acyl-carrier-protein] synthase-3